jgi:hypothetical protein
LLGNGLSLLEMLSPANIDEAQVREGMKQLAAHINELAAGYARSSDDKNVASEALTAHSRAVGTDSERDT